MARSHWEFSGGKFYKAWLPLCRVSYSFLSELRRPTGQLVVVKAIHLGQLPSQNLQNLATDRQPCSVNRTNPQCLDNSCPFRFRHSSVPLQSASKRLLEATFTFCVSCQGLRGHRGHRGGARRARRSWRGRVRLGRPCAPCTSPARPRPQASRRRRLKVKFGFLRERSKSIDISHEKNWDRMH